MTEVPTRVPDAPVSRRAPQAATRTLAAIGIIVLVVACVATIVAIALGTVVDGPSMQPTLHNGDRLIRAPASRSPHRGDVVTLHGPTGGGDIVKRVIGLPGDTVAIAAYDGRPTVWVRPVGGQWSRLVEPYEAGRPWANRTACCSPDGRAAVVAAPVVIPSGHYWVLGDNRDPSIDSRSFGFVTARSIDGVLVWRLWPFGSFDPGRPTLVAADPPFALLAR